MFEYTLLADAIGMRYTMFDGSGDYATAEDNLRNLPDGADQANQPLVHFIRENYIVKDAYSRVLEDNEKSLAGIASAFAKGDTTEAERLTLISLKYAGKRIASHHADCTRSAIGWGRQT